MDAASLANLQSAISDGASIPAAEGDPFAKLWSRENAFDGIWPEHVSIVTAFLAVCSQWRVSPVSQGGMMTPASGMIAPTAPLFIGLDYASVRVGLDAELIDVTPTLWRGLRVMEAEACAALNEGLK